MPEFSDYVEGLPAAPDTTGTVLIPGSKDGDPMSFTPEQLGAGSGSRPALPGWDASGDVMPTDAAAIGSGTAGAILKGDMVVFTVASTAGMSGGPWPIGTMGIALQDSPTLIIHWRLW